MRRTVFLLLMLAVVALGAVLYLNIRESRLFRITAPAQPTSMQQAVGGSTVSLTAVSTSTLLENPRYTGQDPENRRWEVTAINAQQQGTSASTTLILQQVNANLEVPSKSGSTTITLKADNGDYVQAENLLHLKGNVQVEGQGLTLNAPAITTNLNDRHLLATGGIHATLTMPPHPPKK